MAPKKSVLLLTALLLTIGLATSTNSIDVSQNEVWLNSDTDEVYFQVGYDGNCVSDGSEGDTRSASVNLNEEEITNYTPSSSTKLESGEYNFTFSDFQGKGTYTVEATCEHSQNSENLISSEKEFDIDNLSMSISDLPGDGVIEYGETFEGKISASTDAGLIDIEPSDLSYSLTDGSEVSDLSVENDGSFTVKAPENRPSDEDNIAEFGISGEFQDFSVQSSESLELDTYAVENFDVRVNGDSINQRVKYRNMQDVSFRFRVLEKGNPVTDLSLSDFQFDGNPGSDWFNMNYRGDGVYVLSLKSTTSPGGQDYQELKYLIEAQGDSGTFEVGKLLMEKEVEFSGNVIDVNRGSVPTTFTATFSDGRTVTEPTTENGQFQIYSSENKADLLEVDFPEAGFSLDQFDFVREVPNNNRDEVDNIRYNYYEKPDENLDLSLNGVRPINLVSAKINYGFKEDIDNTRGYMEYDSSRVDDYGSVEVYECSYWEFEAESCATEWEKIPDNDVGFYSTSVPEFPVTPLSSNNFRGVDNILSNAYLVGIPKGVGSGLTLDSSLDVSNSRVASGDEITISGRIIDDTTGDSVEGVDVGLDLVREENEVSESETTDENGNFEFTTSVEEAGNYDVEFSASKSPYESFEQSQSDAIEVYYETGLSVESDSNPEIGLGEDYNIEYEVENVGQASVNDIELSVSGVDNGETSLSPTSISSLEPGSSETVVLTVNLDEDLRTPPSITFEAEGTSADQTVTQTSSTLVSLADDVTTGQEDTEETETSQTDTEENDSSSSIPNPSEIQQATGEFIESQSDMNLALGLILVFAAILAVAVKDKKDGSGDRRGGRDGRGRGRANAPTVAPTKVKPSEEDEPEEDSKDSSEEEESDEEESEEDSGESEDDSESAECDVCGETFDTKSGLKLHKQALH